MGYFTSEKLNSRVTRITCPGNVYTFLVEGDHSAALIDTGFGVGSLKQYVDTLTKLPYIVILTHGHLDHAGGAGEFEQVYLNRKDLQLAAEHTSLEIRASAVCKEEYGIDRTELVLPKSTEGYLPLEDGQSFDLGGVTVTMLALSGHTQGSMCMLVNELRTVLLGDACNSFGFLQLPESSSIAEYHDNLIAFQKNADKFDHVWYSHPHNFGGKEIIEDTITLCEEILSGKRVGVPENEGNWTEETLLAKPKDEHDRPLDGSAANFLYKKVSAEQ